MVTELTFNDPLADTPSRAKIALKRHQRTLLYKCIQHEKNNIQISENRCLKSNIGVIGDQVGSGKSFVVLSIILNEEQIADRTHETIQSYAQGLVTLVDTHRYDNVACNLIVIPHNLVTQWTTYIAEFCDDSIKAKFITRVKHIDELQEDDLYSNDIIVVSNTMYSKFVYHADVRNIMFKRMFFDEADSINLPACRRLQATFYWFVTASVNNILKPYGEYGYLWSIDNYVEHIRGIKNSGFIKDTFTNLYKQHNITHYLIAKNDNEYVQSSLLLPDIRTHCIQCKTSQMLTMMSQFVNSDVMQALHAHDYKRAIECLNSKHKNSEENIINVLLERYNKELNIIEAKKNYTMTLIYNSEEDKKKDLDKINQEYLNIQNIMQNIRDRVKNSSFCPICYEDYKNKTIMPCCQNSFCFACLSTCILRNKKCPMCRTPSDVDTIYVVSDQDTKDVGPSDERLNKFDTALKIINDNPDGRYLILSAFDESFNNLGPQLAAKNIKYAFLKGNNSVIQNIIRKYNDKEIDVLLINPRYYGSGMNLEMTSDIIMFHKLDTEMEKQIIGRAQRLGRTTSLNVWYLVHENEISS